MSNETPDESASPAAAESAPGRLVAATAVIVEALGCTESRAVRLLMDLSVRLGRSPARIATELMEESTRTELLDRLRDDLSDDLAP
jgi:hypothetical protein